MKKILLFLIFFSITSNLEAYLHNKVIKNGKVYENIEYGEIDWTDGVLKIKGTAKLPAVIKNKFDIRVQSGDFEYAPDRATARLMALNKAKELAIRNLTSAIYNLRVKDNYYVKNYLENSTNDFDFRLNQYITTKSKNRVLYNKDGSISVELTINLWGKDGFLSIIKKNDKELIAFNTNRFRLSVTNTNISKGGETIIPQEYTSLIIDATEIENLQPALSPSILDESGNIIYNSSFVLKYYASQKGVVKYISDKSLVADIDFVDERAFLVRAISKGKNDTDIVIPDDVVKQLFSSDKTFKHLQRCNVIIIIK